MSTLQTEPELSAFRAYEQTAGVYDQLTAHHDYDLWLGNLIPALEQRGLRRGHLLDVACGTGNSFLPMLGRGWRVTGVDISPAMVARARAKSPGHVRLDVADMRQLPVLGSFELVWCLDDSINYLLEANEMEACLKGLARNLASDGLCLFDLNTVSAYRWFFAATEVIEGDPRLVWRGQEGPSFAPGSIAAATLQVGASGSAPGTSIVHRQRHFASTRIEAALASAELELLARYGITTEAVLEQPLDEDRHTKAIYIARRAKRR